MIFLALVHYPVLNRQGETITSAVTNMDLHDISRAARTYGVSAFYVVTPIAEQQELVRELVSHWTMGVGGTLNPDRKRAMELIRICPDIHSVVAEISLEFQCRPVIYATTAKVLPGQLGWKELKEKIEPPGLMNVLLLFGTASGLHSQVLEQADGVLEPIRGTGEYNHLSVRSAVSITLDRLRRNY